MTPTPYDQAALQPLVTDTDIERRVADLIGRANIRQLWLLFLDADGGQLPLLVPIEGLPTQPSGQQAQSLVSTMAQLMLEIEASCVVAVWERYGSPALTAQDVAWARALDESCREQGVALRAMLLSHRTGVRWIAEDEIS